MSRDVTSATVSSNVSVPPSWAATALATAAASWCSMAAAAGGAAAGGASGSRGAAGSGGSACRRTLTINVGCQDKKRRAGRPTGRDRASEVGKAPRAPHLPPPVPAVVQTAGPMILRPIPRPRQRLGAQQGMRLALQAARCASRAPIWPGHECQEAVVAARHAQFLAGLWRAALPLPLRSAALACCDGGLPQQAALQAGLTRTVQPYRNVQS